MTSIIVTCATCGAPFEPDRMDIVRGRWKVCPTCRPGTPTPPSDNPGGRCERCGRALRTAGRTLCLQCLGIAIL